MSRKHFSALLLATVLVAVLVLMLPVRTGKESSLSERFLVSQLADEVNAIDWLRLSKGGDGEIVTLVRTDDGWVVEGASAYRADWGLVKGLLASMAQAEVVEQKTSNPELYEKLGVGDVTGTSGTGVLVEFAPATGLPSVIFGNRAQGRDGQYARLADTAQSVLVNAAPDLPETRADWLDRDIIDISDAEVVEYEIVQANGESVRALKASADDENFALQDIPDGREIKSEWSVNAPANALAALQLQDVVPASELSWEGATRFRVLTADGLTVELELQKREGDSGTDGEAEQWVRLEADIFAPDERSSEEESQPVSETRQRADRINDQVSGWAYRIAPFRAESMSRVPEDMLKPVVEENEPPAL